jgi:hypothetical protein
MASPFPTSFPANAATNILQYAGFRPAFFIPRRRSIGGIVAQVTIDEQASDDVQITEHPVEQGAPIADHAFKRPAVVTIRAGWSRQYAWDLSAETGVYGLLLSWQAALLPFDVVTGKRNYTNMLIERLQVTTDNHTEFALMATITCRQVIIVSTSTTNVAGASANDSDHNDPASTGGEANSGEKQSSDTGTSLAPGGGATLAGSASSGTGTGLDQNLGAPTGPQPPSYIKTEPSTGMLAGGAFSTPTGTSVSLQMSENFTAVPNNPPVVSPTVQAQNMGAVIYPP